MSSAKPTTVIPTGLPVLYTTPDQSQLEVHILPSHHELFQSVHTKFFAVSLDEYQAKNGLTAFHDLTLVRPSKLQSGFIKTETNEHCFIAKIDVSEYTEKVLAARMTVSFAGGRSMHTNELIDIHLVFDNTLFYKQSIQLPIGSLLKPGTSIDQWIPLYIA